MNAAVPRPPRRRVSIRTRLTLWYAALLALVLAVLGGAVLALAGNRLQADMDRRLFTTAQDVAAAIDRQLAARRAVDPVILLEEVAPGLGSFSSRGLLVQVVGADGSVASRSEAAPAVPMLPVPGADARPVASFSSRTVNGWSVRAVGYPLILGGPDGRSRPVGAVLVAERTETLDETLASLRQVLLWSSLAGLALAAGGGWLLAGRALRPVDRLTAAAAAIAADGGAASLATRVPAPPGQDELGRLAATFNAMLDRIQTSFEAQRRFVADASHELRTPLAAIRGNTDVMVRQATTLPVDEALRSDLLEAAEDVRRESARMGRLLDDLLLLARSDAAAFDPGGAGALRQPPAAVPLDEVARDAVRSAAGLANGQVLTANGSTATVAGDRDRLLQLLLILLDNAIRHTPPGKRIAVETGVAADGRPTVAVRDEGGGIAPEHLPRLFDRFYRADPARDRASGGVGLGLAIARAIARAHGGEIAVDSAPGAGSSFVVRFPPPTALLPAVAGGRETARQGRFSPPGGDRTADQREVNQ